MLWTASGPSQCTQLGAGDTLHDLWTFRGRTARCKAGTKEMLWTASGPSEGAQPGEGMKEMLCTTCGPSEGTQLGARDALHNLWTFSGCTTRCTEGTNKMLWAAWAFRRRTNWCKRCSAQLLDLQRTHNPVQRGKEQEALGGLWACRGRTNSCKRCSAQPLDLQRAHKPVPGGTEQEALDGLWTFRGPSNWCKEETSGRPLDRPRARSPVQGRNKGDALDGLWTFIAIPYTPCLLFRPVRNVRSGGKNGCPI